MTDQAADSSATGLFQTERHREIAALAQTHSRVEVADLAERFGVTTETIRRDLSDLQKLSLVRRVHGGAVAWKDDDFEPLLSVRDDQHGSEKARIAKAAVEELPPSGAVIIDSGSTLGRFSKEILHEPRPDLHVVTNSLIVAQNLAKGGVKEVIVLGGKVRPNTLAMVDAETVSAVGRLHVDTAFISCDGLSPERGLSTPYREEAELKREMIRVADRVVALVDHSKFGNDYLTCFAEWPDVDVLITNSEADPAVVARLESQGTVVRLT